jgi:DNA polymerase III subunit delta'
MSTVFRYNCVMNWNMIGHEQVVQSLKRHILNQDVRHAYLLTGPPGIGKRTLAIRLAQAINCIDPQSPAEPCGKCRICAQTERMAQVDMTIIQSETEGGMIKVDQIRSLQHSLSLKPLEACFRIALLLRFQEANASAQNALLKTLEEAPEKVILCLTADSAEALLPTIVSRCEVVRMHPLPVNKVVTALHDRWSLPDDEARNLGFISGGRPGYAIYLHENPDILKQRYTWIDDLHELLKSTRRERFVYAESIAKDKDKVRQALQVWLSYWRDILLTISGCQYQVVNQEWDQQIASVSEKLDLARVRMLTTEIEDGLIKLESNVNPRLLVEVLMLDMPRL